MYCKIIIERNSHSVAAMSSHDSKVWCNPVLNDWNSGVVTQHDNSAKQQIMKSYDEYE